MTTLDNRALLEDTRIVLYMTWITWYWWSLRQNQLSLVIVRPLNYLPAVRACTFGTEHTTNLLGFMGRSEKLLLLCLR
jgi:hypothetical protein